MAPMQYYILCLISQARCLLNMNIFAEKAGHASRMVITPIAMVDPVEI